MSEIKNALGLGEKITFSDGTHLDCVPASLADLTDAMANWSKSLGKGISVQGCYMPDKGEAKEAFEELLYVACGKNIPKEELVKKIRITDGGKEVVAFIDRFLGFEPRKATAENDQG